MKSTARRLYESNSPEVCRFFQIVVFLIFQNMWIVFYTDYFLCIFEQVIKSFILVNELFHSTTAYKSNCYVFQFWTKEFENWFFFMESVMVTCFDQI